MCSGARTIFTAHGKPFPVARLHGDIGDPTAIQIGSRTNSARGIPGLFAGSPTIARSTVLQQLHQLRRGLLHESQVQIRKLPGETAQARRQEVWREGRN